MDVTSNYDGKRFDYRANVQYQWTDTLMTYLQYATGFKGGGISPRPFSAAQAVPFNPETLKSYEAGIKCDFLDRRAARQRLGVPTATTRTCSSA